MKKTLLTLAATIAIATSAQAGPKQIIASETSRSFERCALKVGFVINPLYDKGLKVQKIVDSPAEQMLIYTVRVGKKTGFFTCTGNHYKVWVEDFS